jgi:quercetin dioxygenase-like cupin family protein
MEAMLRNYKYNADLAAAPVPGGSLHECGHVAVQQIWLEAGGELAERVVRNPSILQFIRGEAVVTVDGDERPAQAGTFFIIPPGHPHSIRASETTAALLTMVKHEPHEH